MAEEMWEDIRDKAPTRQLLPPNETTSAGNGFHLIELLAKVAYGNPRTTQAIAKAIGCHLQINSRPHC